MENYPGISFTTELTFDLIDHFYQKVLTESSRLSYKIVSF